MDASPRFEQTYHQAVPELSVPWPAEAPPDPELVWLDEELAAVLGLDAARLRGPEGIALLTGQTPELRRSSTAQAYAGHQFGHPSPSLGDGRAVLLGELVDPRGARWDLHLKGAGRTPFARGGDGKAPLGPMLREAVVSTFLHAMGVPTTRALAVLTTGERIAPRRGTTPEPGAVLVRVAASHLRVGTVEHATWHHDRQVLRGLVDHAIDRHHPAAREAEVPALALLEAVRDAQAELVAQWMLLGFVHGVMNTDNMTLSGEGIDYGPCAFLDTHRRGAVFSSIDRGGRYAYGNQPGIALWNLSRLAEGLLPLIDEEDPSAAVDAATHVLEGYEARYVTAWTRGLAAKLGLPGDADPEDVAALGTDLFALLEERRVDHTRFFLALAAGEAGALVGDDEAWRALNRRLRELGAGPADDGVNPRVIPRNVPLDTALRAAHLGDLAPVRELLAAVRRPGRTPVGAEHLELPGEGGDELMTFCGT